MKKRLLCILLAVICVLVCCFALFSCFKKGEYNIILSENGYGSVSVKESADAGDKVRVKVKGSEEYENYSVYVNGEEISGDEFTMPESDVHVAVTFANTSSSANTITVAGSADGKTVACLSSAEQGQKITLTAYPIYNRTLDYFVVNGEKIEGNSFIMPNSSITVGAVYKEVYGETNISVSLTASYQTADSYWYARYTESGIEVRAVVDDNLVFTSKKGTTDIAMADNIEFIIGLKTDATTFTSGIYKMLVNAEGEYFYQQGNGSGFTTISSDGIDVKTEKLSVFTHGFLGYAVTVTIPYSKLGTTYEAALGNLCICPAMRNTTNTLKTAWTSYSGMNCNWSVPSSHILIDENGKMDVSVGSSTYLFAGDETLSSIASVSGMEVLSGRSTHTVNSSTIRYWITNIQDILRYGAKEVYFSCGRADLDSGSVLSVFKDMREFITFFKSSTDAKLHIVSCIPSIYSDDLKAVAAFNLMVKEYVEQVDGVEYIDFCSDVLHDGTVNETMYASATTLSDEGNRLLKKYVLTARNAYSEKEVNSDWGSVGPYIYSGDWSYSNDTLFHKNGGSSVLYYKNGLYTDFIFECSITAYQIYNGDLYPKFGIVLCNENHSRYYYVSAVGLTEQLCGVVEKPYTGFDWLNDSTFAVDSLEYKMPSYATFKIVKCGNEIVFYINGQAVANTSANDFGEGGVAFGLFSFNLALNVKNIRVVTDPVLVQQEVKG